MLEELCLKTLGELDNGSAELAIDAAIRSAMRDLEDRGKDGKPRTVEIKLSLGLLDNNQPVAGIEVAVKTPARKTAGTIGNFRFKDGEPGFQFQTLAPKEPDQRCIDDEISRRQKTDENREE